MAKSKAGTTRKAPEKEIPTLVMARQIMAELGGTDADLAAFAGTRTGDAMLALDALASGELSKERADTIKEQALRGYQNTRDSAKYGEILTEFAKRIMEAFQPRSAHSLRPDASKSAGSNGAKGAKGDAKAPPAERASAPVSGSLSPAAQLDAAFQRFFAASPAREDCRAAAEAFDAGIRKLAPSIWKPNAKQALVLKMIRSIADPKARAKELLEARAVDLLPTPHRWACAEGAPPPKAKPKAETPADTIKSKEAEANQTSAA